MSARMCAKMYAERLNAKRAFPAWALLRAAALSLALAAATPPSGAGAAAPADPPPAPAGPAPAHTAKPTATKPAVAKRATRPRRPPRVPVEEARIEGPDTAPVRRIEGEPYIAVNDLARLLDATKFWRPDLRKLVLRGGRHSITFTADNPFVVVDETTIWLPSPVVSLRGEFQVPAALVDTLPSDSTFARLYFDQRHDRVLLLPASGGVGTPLVSIHPSLTRVSFPADDPEAASVVARSREHFRVRFGGLFTGAMPESLPPGGLLEALSPIAVVGGSALELRVAREAVGYRLIQNPQRGTVVVELSREPAADLEPFAAEGPIGPRPIRVVVIDPGHGGSDPGVIAGGAVEKDLTLALARLLKAELERRLNAHVVLTRSDDRAVDADRRAEIANRSHADLVLSLHFDGFPGNRAHGATAYCPPATFAGPEGAAGPDAVRSQVVMLPWRDVALRHAVESRSLAEAILTALELRGQGPTRLRERLLVPLLGVNAPGLVLECAALTTPADRERLRQGGGLHDLATTLAEGVLTWQRNQ
jgi:N-acetylmuramoyl-L-alanine amidase